ncbi:MAG: hypothetical protein ACJ780_14190 [Solirubrobacteraceae bacterium]
MSGQRLMVAFVAVLAVTGALAGIAQAQGTINAQCASGSQTQLCDSHWYTSPVSVSWQFTGGAFGVVSGCQVAAYDSDTVDTPSCAVTWSSDGSTSSLSFRLHLETSAPSATTTPDRPPDANGWYNHPVSVTFAGTAFSGIASCTPAQAYAGPDTSGTSIGGTCQDNAGKTAGASFPFRYDATPPSLRAATQPADRSVNLTWQASAGPAPLQAIQVVRAPGVSAAAASVVYQGPARSYRDRRVRNGTRYTYTVTATDQAGNVTRQMVSAIPGARLLSPAPGAHLGAPPTLNWTAIPKASYYNVQLFKGREKLLSAWPPKPNLHLKRTWRFAGQHHRLTRGRYRWYVWPGFGSRKAAHYGHRVGTATFVIR